MRTLALGIGLVLVGCSSSPDAGPTLFPDTQLFSGADPAGGGATYKVTIASTGATGVTWASADPTIASATGTDAEGTVTALKVGSTTITATAGGATISVPLTVNSYSAAELMAGSIAFTQTHTCARSGCHDSAGPDISPSGIGKHTDAQIQAATVSGANPEGGEVSIGAAMHSFPLSGPDDMVGIAAYCRALPPGTPINDD